jgi:hypothetical protein
MHMHTPFSVVVSRFLKVSELSIEESRYSHNLIVGPGKTILTPDDDMLLSMREPTPCKAAMVAFLGASPVFHLYALVALMYSGRDEVDNPLEYWMELKHSVDSPEAATAALVSKVVRNRFIEAAVARLKPQSELDALPARIANSAT